MRFNPKHFLVIAPLIMSSGCGMLGAKNPADLSNKEIGNGCLNNSKNLFDRYTSGQISESEWKNSFDCVGQSLDFFVQYVKGSNVDSYTQSDMYAFVSKFLITNNTVHRDLLRGAFQLKAALLGGTSAEFKKDEIETFKSILPKVRDITADLIPYLRIQAGGSASYNDYLEMAEAFKHAGAQLSDLVNSLPVGMLSEQSVALLIDQLSDALGMPKIANLSDKMFVAKWFLLNSRPDAIEVQDWGQVVKTALTFGGYLFAMQKAPAGDLLNDYQYREFITEVVNRIRPLLNDAVMRHGGAIPLPLIDHIVDLFPLKELFPASDMDVPPQLLKQSLRPIMRKIFQSQTQIGIDAGVLDTFYTLFNEWSKNTGMLDRLYEKAALDPLSTSPSLMRTALNQYGSTLSKPEDIARFNKLSHDLLNYIPQFYRDTHFIRFQRGIGYSKFQHFFVITGVLLGEHLHKVYGSGDTYFVEDDFHAAYDDYKDILYALKVIDITVVNWAGKRFSELDLFTPVSDGNGKASVQELVYYAMLIISAGEWKTKMAETIIPACDTNIGVDLLGWKWIAMPCFRSYFNDHLENWLEQFPNLKAYWLTLSDAQKKKAMSWLEHGARRNGYTDEDIASFDFQTLPTILHYAESLFARFSGSDDNMVLTKDQVMQAYPVFKFLLAQHANGMTNPTMLEGIFTYIVRYREMPDSKSVKGIAKLIWWIGFWKLPKNQAKVKTDRLGFYNIVCLLAAPESKKQQDLTPQICKE